MALEKTRYKLQTGAHAVIVGLGDSLTYGWDVTKGYIDFIRTAIPLKYPSADFQLINQGIPGDTAVDGLYRTERDVIRYNPDLVLIQFALNDAFTGCSEERYEKGIRGIVEKIRSDTDSEILLITSVSLGTRREEELVYGFYQRLVDVSETEGVPVALVHEYWKRRISEGIDFNTLVQADQVHPTEAGYRLMAEAVMLHI